MPVTQRQFALLVGITQQAVAKHVAAGVLRDGGVLGEWLRSYCEKLRAEASGRSGDESLALTRAKTREAEAKAQRLELDLAREVGALAYIEDIEPALQAWASAARTGVEGAIDKIVEGIESKHGITIERDEYDQHLRDALRVIARYPREYDPAA